MFHTHINFGESRLLRFSKESGGTSDQQERKEALVSAEGKKQSLGLEEAQKSMQFEFKKSADVIEQIANGWGPLKQWRIKRQVDQLAMKRLEQASPKKATDYLYYMMHPWERRAAFVAARETVNRDLQGRFESEQQRMEQLQQRYKSASNMLRSWVRKPFTVRELKRSNVAVTSLKRLQNPEKMRLAFSRLNVQKIGVESEAILVSQLAEYGVGEAETRKLITAHKEGRPDLYNVIKEKVTSSAMRSGLNRAAKYIRKYQGRYELAAAMASDLNSLASTKKLESIRKPAIVGCALEVIQDDGIKAPLVVQAANLPMLTVKNTRTGKTMILDTRGKKGYLTYRGPGGIVDLALHGAINRLIIPQETCARLALAGDETPVSQAA